MNKLPIYEAVLGQEDQIQLISFVDNPAIQENFVYFSDNKPVEVFENTDKQIVVAPIMVPDKLIYRYNDRLGEFYTKFSKETIKQIVYQYSKDNYQNNSNLNHKTKLDGIVMMESWIKESNIDKSSEYGFTELPVGTWFAIYKIDNQELWSKIKEKKINGMSIEGYLSYQLEQYFEVPKESFNELSIQDELKVIFNKEKLVATPQAGETKNEFLSRCIPLEIRKGHPQDQAIAICEVTWTNK